MPEISILIPTISILIPTIPSRIGMFEKLFNKLNDQACNHLANVEILALFDNKRRTIGQKRDALVQLAKGKYIAFCDDDDDVSNDYIKELLKAIEYEPDVVTFKQQAIINGEESIIDFDLNNKNEPFSVNKVTRRKPFHVCAFRSVIAKRYRFNDTNYGEDWDWCKRVLKDVKTQYKINKVLHTYIFDSKITEAV